MLYIIVNPASKSGKGIQIWHEVVTILHEKAIEYKAFKTRLDFDATTITRKIFEKDTSSLIRIIALGGDGTINEVIQGIPEDSFKRALVGYLPTGSSNDLARDFGCSSDYIKNFEHLINSDNFRLMDLGRLHYNSCDAKNLPDRYFAVSCGIGFDASVCHEALNSSLKNSFNKAQNGKLTYSAICLKQLMFIEKSTCTITIDDGAPMKYDKCYFVTMMNHRYQGGGIMFCPDAVDNDGYLDICYAHTISKARAISILPYAFKGKHVGKDGIVITKASTINIKTDIPLYVHTDGEVKTKATDITVTCIKEKLRFII